MAISSVSDIAPPVETLPSNFNTSIRYTGNASAGTPEIRSKNKPQADHERFQDQRQLSS
jgi:hypothetical protein